MHTIEKIRNLMRVASVSSALVATAGFGLASAHVKVSDSNYLTGANSLNKNLEEFSSFTKLDVDNVAKVKDEIKAQANTGWNDYKQNTKIEDIDTGFIDIGGTFVNEVNKDPVNITMEDLGKVEVDLRNGTTGANSENKNTVKVENKSKIDIDNKADIDNKVKVETNTGHNDIKQNTEVGDVSTGSTRVRVNLENSANAGAANLTLDGGAAVPQEVKASFSNDVTGYNSENINTLNVKHSSIVDIDNKADIKNIFSVQTNTGHNDIIQNTKVGDVSTGDILINLSAKNVAN